MTDGRCELDGYRERRKPDRPKKGLDMREKEPSEALDGVVDPLWHGDSSALSGGSVAGATVDGVCSEGDRGRTGDSNPVNGVVEERGSLRNCQ